MDLFIEIIEITDDNLLPSLIYVETIHLPITMKSLILFCIFPKFLNDLNIYFISKSIKENIYKLELNKIFTGSQLLLNTVSAELIPAPVRHLQLPVLILQNRPVVFTGFAPVIRQLILRQYQSPHPANKNDPKCPHRHSSLLGVNQACLKACHERSKWVILCQTSMPKAVMTALEFNDWTCLNALLSQLEEYLTVMKARPQPGTKRTYFEGKFVTLVDCLLTVFLWELGGLSNESWLEIPSIVGPLSLLRDWYELMLANHIQLVDQLILLSARFHVKHSGLSVDFTESFIEDNYSSLVGGIYSHLKNRDGRKKTSDILMDVRSGESVLRKLTDEFGNFLQRHNHLSIPLKPTFPCHNLIDQTFWSRLPIRLQLEASRLPTKRVVRKRQQITNLVNLVLSIPLKPNDVIVDFCSGCGSLGLILAWLLPDCRVVLVENKEESLRIAEESMLEAWKERASAPNVCLYNGNLTQWTSTINNSNGFGDSGTGDFHLGVALHACGSVTDLVIEACLQDANRPASFIISPCCYGSIKPNHRISNYPRCAEDSNGQLDFRAVYRRLIQAADRVCDDFQRSERLHDDLLAREAMNLVDLDRLVYVSRRSPINSQSKLQLLKMDPVECTPRNNIIFFQADR